jgi:hypothetical protein
MLSGCERVNYLKQVSYQKLAKVQRIIQEREALSKELERYIPKEDIVLNQSWDRLKHLNERLSLIAIDEKFLDEQHQLVELEQLHAEIERQILFVRLELRGFIKNHEIKEYMALMARFDSLEDRLDHARNEYYFSRQKYINEILFNRQHDQSNSFR